MTRRIALPRPIRRAQRSLRERLPNFRIHRTGVLAPALTRADLINETTGALVLTIYNNASGQTIPKRQLAPSANFQLVPLVAGGDIRTDDTYRIELTFNGVIANPASPVGSHPGLNLMIGYNPLSASGGVGAEQWCAFDLSSVTTYNSPATPGPFDDYWRGCTSSSCANPDQNTPRYMCPAP